VKHPRAIPRTGADLARAARTAKASSVPASRPAPEATAEPKPTGSFVGALGVADAPADPNETPFEERPGVTVLMFPWPSFTSNVPPSTTVIRPASSGLKES
jgi:hypothetical protein